MDKRVAIVAHSFRFPSTNTQNFWTDLLAKKDLITEVNATRWSKDSFLHPDKRHAGTSYTFAAGSLGDISGFDAAFFAISPREAALMDPQQRLLLEMAWETFENAGIVPKALRGSDCGVFIGLSSVDYAYRLADDFAAIDAFAGTGTISSIAANRISYVFDLHGPSMTLDTACSSSLVAFHQACQAIRSGEISQALAGGINLHLHPYGFLSFSKATMLSKTGRCHVFDEAGDGYVRSEGGGLFFLKNYAQAIADGDTILAVVAGSGVNTDGSKSGLTIPNHLAQAALMTQVYEQADIAPDAVDYFEAHGTGTAVGDPIETHAIGMALGQKRQKPLLIGSVKSNLGHLESASGVAGLAKALGCIQHRTVPASIGMNKPNPNIKFTDWNLRVVTETQALKAQGKLTIGINSFGFGGANAHVVLESPAPAVKKQKKTPRTLPLVPLLISAKTPEALEQAALDMADFLEQSSTVDFYDLAYSAFFHREQHALAAVVFSDNATLAATQLKTITDANTPVYKGVHLAQASGAAFIYSGNGCQWQGMGKQLLAQSETFRRVVSEINTLFQQYADFSLLDELAGKNGNRYDYTEIAQPALFALQVGITEVLREHGIDAVAVAGHSVGEVAAAWAAGALSLAAAVKVIYYRSVYQGKTKGLGGMTAVGLSAADCAALLVNPLWQELQLAGINSYRGVTIAGSVAQLALLETELASRNIFYKRLDLDYAFHSPAMDGIEAGITRDLTKLDGKTAILPYFSTVTGAAMPKGDSLRTAQYWWQNIRQPVLFESAVTALLNTGVNTFIEIGAHPVLRTYLNDSLKAHDSVGIVIPTVLRNDDSLTQLTGSIAQTLMAGVASAQKHWFSRVGQFVALPNYPWQRESLWHGTTAESLGLLNRHKVHPLLGYKLAQHDMSWENQLDTQLQPYLADHNVGGAVVFPGAGFVEIAAAAAYNAQPCEIIDIEELEIRAPLLLSHEQSKVIRVALEASDGRLSLHSRELATSSDLSLHLVGRVLHETNTQALTITAPALPERLPDFDASSHAQLTHSVGLDYGVAFQALSGGWLEQNQVHALFAIPDSLQADFDSYYLHPALLDCAFQAIFQLLKDESLQNDGIAFVPIKVGRLQLRSDKAVPHRLHATLLHRSPHSLKARFVLYDANDAAIAVVDDVRFRAVRLHRSHAQHLHYLDYQLIAAPLQGNLSQFNSEQLHKALQTAIEQGQADSLRYSNEVEPLLDSLCQQFVDEAAQTENDADVAAVAIWNALIQEYPDYFYPIHLVGRVGLHSGELAQGVLRPDDIDITSALYARISNQLLARTSKKPLTELLLQQCQQFMQTLPCGERLRLLEISAYKPVFANQLCAQLDFDQSDYSFASFCPDALGTAEALHERFPLLQVVRLNVNEPAAMTPANFAIVNLNTTDVQELYALIQQLPHLLVANSPVLFIGWQPARWIDYLLNNGQDSDAPSLQLSAQQVLSVLSDFAEPQLFEFMQGSYSGTYLISTRINTVPAIVPSSPENWLVLADAVEIEQTLATAIAQRLMQHGHSVTVASPLSLLDTQIPPNPPLSKGGNQLELESYQHIVHCAGFGQADVNEQTHRCQLATTLVQACESLRGNRSLWLLTHNVGSMFASDSKTAALFTTGSIANDAALWGFGRVLLNEASNYHVQLLDVHGDVTANLDALLSEFLHGDKEQEVMLNAGKRFVPRLHSHENLAVQTPAWSAQEKEQTLQLEFKLPGQLRLLHWQAKPSVSPAADEIEVSVKATGLNFRDVMYTLGLLSDEAVENGFVGATLGLEFAGEISRVGQDVTTFKVGDKVVGMGSASFSNRVITKANAVALIPNSMTFAAAATIPSTFFTVYYALHHQARLQAGEKILIHGAAGGVGLAAIQIAQWLGAEIYATAGSEEKRDFLRLLGVEHIYDSRSLHFAEQILAQTNQRGIDVVLNSLAGEAINRNFQILKPFGRFLELGKRDFYENTRIGLRPFRNNISYFGIDADQLMQERPELTRQLFTEMMQLFTDGVLSPLPHSTFDANQVVEAFRYMQQAKQIGKIVVTYNYGITSKSPVPLYQNEETALHLLANASYLVTGGLNGFGLRTAQWLVEKGAKHLILLSRSGARSDTAKAALADFAQQGVSVYAAACDVTDRAALQTVLQQAEATMPALKGVIHAAAVIDDSLARNLNAEKIQTVLAPKILGAWHLHELTKDKALDLFVLYSSITTLFGNPGQSNYVAANHWLEALTAHRRGQGLPASCVRWGAIDDVGFLARNEKIKEALQNRMGGSALSSATALNVLEQIIQTNSPTVGVMEFDWRALSSFLPSASSPKFRAMARKNTDANSSEENRLDISRLLHELSDAQLHSTFVDMLKDELSQILLVAKEKIQADASMYDMGLDSLMGVELMVAIEGRFGVQIPVMALSEAPTLNKLVQRLIIQLRGGDDSDSNDTLAQINDLSNRHGSAISQEQMTLLTQELQDSSGASGMIS